jgi:hypothetical protein
MLASSCAGVKDMAVMLYVHRVSAARGAVMRFHVARRQSGMYIIGRGVSGWMGHTYALPSTAACTALERVSCSVQRGKVPAVPRRRLTLSPQRSSALRGATVPWRRLTQPGVVLPIPLTLPAAQRESSARTCIASATRRGLHRAANGMHASSRRKHRAFLPLPGMHVHRACVNKRQQGAFQRA